MGAGTMTGGFRDLLPTAVEVEQTPHDAPAGVLFPEESAVVAKAVPRRRAEFAAVRDCARRALRRLGQPPAPILPGPNREPRWPAGVVGSLTHCEGCRAAAVARRSDVLALGIDAEPNEPLPEGVAEMVAVAAEARRIARLARVQPDVAWDRLLFSAKESIYKAWFPLTRTWLDFTDCELTVRSDDGTFTGRLLVVGHHAGGRTIERLNGRWTVHGRHILTAVWEPAAGPAGLQRAGAFAARKRSLTAEMNRSRRA